MNRPQSVAVVIVLALPLLTGMAAAQRPAEITVDVRSPAGAQSQPRDEDAFLNGYRATVSGEVLLYHSAHPDAEEALLVRANKEAHSISWVTDTLRNPAGKKFVTFIWLAGLERSGWGESAKGHPFEFFINGEHYFTFRNFKDSTDRDWRLAGKGNAELSFRAQIADKFGDLFGYMFLKVPVEQFPQGAPLALQVVGEEAQSPEWYMTFQYHFNFQPRVIAEPALFRHERDETQVLRVSLDNLVPGRSVEITGSDGIVKRDTLLLGANIFLLPIRRIDSPESMAVTFMIDGKLLRRTRVAIPPVVRRTMYLLSHSHNDIGYTDIQPVVEKKQWENIDQALKLIEATRDYPPDAKFKWNVEVLWPLESYLRTAPEHQRTLVIDAVRAGNIGLNALYGNELTGLATAAEMSHFTDYARRFSADFGIPITTAVVSDIPGFTWGIVPALSQSGVTYFASGPNSGDRIGYVLQEWGDKPFYWKSQSGDEKVLFWVAGAGYSSFHEGTLAKLGDEKIMKMARRLDDIRYPYEIVQLPYTLGDNGPPDSTLSDFVKNWNARFTTPRLIIGTHKEMFEAFEKRYGAGLPVKQGDFTPYWEDGALSTAYETALCRRAVDRLVEGEAMWSMSVPAMYPKNRYDEAWKNVVLFDEHTWGAGNSVTDPDDPGVKTQWYIKQQFARRADSLSRVLLAQAIPTPSARKTAEHALDVYNPTAWERTGVVLLPATESKGAEIVTDQKGTRVPSQRLSSGELAFRAEGIPPLAIRRFSLKKGSAVRFGSVLVTSHTLENKAVQLSVNQATGEIESLRWKVKDVQFVQPGTGLNAYHYVRGTNPDSARSLTNVRISIGDSGGFAGSLIIEGDAPGCRRYKTQVRLVDGEEKIDIVTSFDKVPVRDKEGVHVGFPFALPDAQVRYDVANAIVRPELDQLQGSCKNFFSVQSWVDVANAEYGITLAVPDAPLIEIGEMSAEQPWRTEARTSPKIFSYVMNNYWHTNYKADQSGEITLRYSLCPHAAFRPEEAARFGRECREPLIVAPASASQPPAPSLFHVEPGEVLVSTVKPAENGSRLLVQIYNPTARDQSVTFWKRKAGDLEMTPSDASGRRDQPVKGPLKVKSFGSGYVLVERK